MKLSKIKKELQKTGRNGFVQAGPHLSIYKNGSFRFTHAAIEKMHLKQLKCVDFLQDEEYPEQWFVKPNELGDYLLNNNRKNNGFYNKNLALKIRTVFKVTDEILRFKIADPITYDENLIYNLQHVDVETLVTHKPSGK